jgi:hypothetical protein
MRIVSYAYIAKPTVAQIEQLFTALKAQSITITHLGKSDPPRKFIGETDKAVALVFQGTDLTNYTFLRYAPKQLDMDIQIRNDPRWSHSTLSVSCSDATVLEAVYNAVLESLELYLFIRGISGLGKDQPWEVRYVGEKCPADLKSKFAEA